jgi:hypothetical protein
MSHRHHVRLTTLLCLMFGLAAASPGTGVRAADDPALLPTLPAREDPPRVFVVGVKDTFDVVREAIDRAKRTSGRDYRVLVVDSAGEGRDARELLDRVVSRWLEESADTPGGFNPAADSTIVLDVGDRLVAMDVPMRIEDDAGLDSGTIEARLIGDHFLPRARDGELAAGLADLIDATETWIKDREDRRRARLEARRVFRERTLPLALAGLTAAAVLGALALQWSRHARRLRLAREKLAAFKGEVVALSDLLDAQQERHRMLPHSDADFRTPMQGLTRATYDGVQGSIRGYRERWLHLMDVWERAQDQVGSEWFLGTGAADAAIRLLDSAEARPPLADVAAACRAPLDALEQAHEQARDLATTLDTQIAATTARIDGLASRGRSGAGFQAALGHVTRARRLAGESLESDPVASRGALEASRDELQGTVARIDALEAADDRRLRAIAATGSGADRVKALRAEGWLLAEPGANPDERLQAAAEHTHTAAQLLDAGETDAALGHVADAERLNAEAGALLESIVAARERARELLPACAARLEALVARRAAAADAAAALAAAYAESSWSDVAGNVARADDGLERARTLIAEAQAALTRERQHDLRAVALLEETVRQEDWVEGCLAAVSDRRAELDELRETLPPRHDGARTRVADLGRRLERQRTDRVRANERCREAGRILDVADDALRAARPDLRTARQLIEAADTAAARGEELADEDERLAAQAESDLEESDSLVRRVAAWYAEGVQADVRGATAALDASRSLLSRQRYEDAIRASAEAAQHARAAYAAATAEAERRRVRRQQEIQRRQLEESFARMSRSVGPWVVRLPGGMVTGPDPWRSLQQPGEQAGSARGAAQWSRDIAQVGW